MREQCGSLGLRAGDPRQEPRGAYGPPPRRNLTRLRAGPGARGAPPGAGEHMGSSGGAAGRPISSAGSHEEGAGGAQPAARHGSVPARRSSAPEQDARPRPDGRGAFGVGWGGCCPRCFCHRWGRNAPAEKPGPRHPPLPAGAPRGHLLATGTGPSGRELGRRTGRIYQLLATADFCICQGANYCL